MELACCFPHDQVFPEEQWLAIKREVTSCYYAGNFRKPPVSPHHADFDEKILQIMVREADIARRTLMARGWIARLRYALGLKKNPLFIFDSTIRHSSRFSEALNKICAKINVIHVDSWWSKKSRVWHMAKHNLKSVLQQALANMVPSVLGHMIFEYIFT